MGNLLPAFPPHLDLEQLGKMSESEDHRDNLTGLPTREALEGLDSAFTSRPGQETWSIMLVDVDHFKLINDVYGHLHGDRVLRQVADILARNVRRTDSVIRYGGDEFVVVMPRTGHLQAANQAQRILEDIEVESFPSDTRVGLSMGVADSREEDRTLTPVMDRADRALYQAKDGGRGRVSFYRDASSESGSAEIAFDHFVDRQHELRSLRSELDEVLSKGGRFALISGEPGVGKSRLVTELLHYCSFRGCHFLQTKLDELGSSRPYSRILAPIARHLLEQTPAQRESFLREAGPLHPRTAQLLEGLSPEIREDHTDPGEREGLVRHAIYSDSSSLLGVISGDRPLVYMVDDLQWISANDLDMLTYLARASSSQRILFVATMRTPLDGYPEVHRQVNVLARLIPFLSVELDHLPEEYAGHMVMFALRDPHIPRNVLQRIVRQSGGNPFYLRELLRSLRESGSITPDDVGGWSYRLGDDVELPESISQLVSSRLDTLDGFSREVIRTGSLAMDGFSLELVASVLERKELEVAKALEQPLKIDLVREELDEDSTPLYRFNHDTVRSYLYQELNLGVRKALSSRFAEHYERLYLSGDSTQLTRVAHYHADGLDREKACGYSLRAAREALDNQSNLEALRWLETYAERSDPHSEDRDDAFFSRTRLGQLYTEAAEHDDARRVLEEARGLAGNDEEKGLVAAELGQLFYNMGEYVSAIEELSSAQDLLPVGETSIRALMRLAFISHIRGNSDEATEMFLRARKMIDGLEEEEERTRKRLEAAFCSGGGFVLAHSRSSREGLELCRRAVELYRELGDRAGEARAILNLAAILSTGGNWEERIRILNRAVDVLTETGDTHSIMVAYVNLGQVYFTLRQTDMSGEYFQRCLALVEATGTKRFEVWCRCYLAMLFEHEDEKHREARESYDMAIARAEELGLSRMLVVCRLNLALMLIQSGSFDEAGSIMDLVETDATLQQMGGSMMNALRTGRALELYLNTDADRDRKTSLEQAVELLESAGDDSTDAEVLNFAENSYYRACCLEELGKQERSREIVNRACDMVDRSISSIRSSIYRRDILETRPIPALFEMRDRMKKSVRETR